MSDLIPATADELLAKIDHAAEVRREQETQELVRRTGWEGTWEPVEAESPDWVTAGLLCLTALVVVAFWLTVVLLLVAM